jgi:hypothetical protein
VDVGQPQGRRLELDVRGEQGRDEADGNGQADAALHAGHDADHLAVLVEDWPAGLARVQRRTITRRAAGVRWVPWKGVPVQALKTRPQRQR